MLDLHAHVLPGIDDGPRTMAESMELLRALQDDGVDHVVATPHIYPGVYDNTPERIAEVFVAMRAEAEAHGLTITLSWGAEVRLCSEMLDWLSADRLTCLGRGTNGVRTVLVEMPDGQVPVGTDRLVARLVSKGLKPLLAHPERNRAVMESLDYLEPLLQAGGVMQLTAGSLLGEFGTKAQITARKLLDRGYGVAAVASDSHNLRGRRPRMTAARAWLVENYGEALALQLTDTGPAQLVGVGQVVFENRDGSVLRDLPEGTTPGAQQQAWSFNLIDLPSKPSASTTSRPEADRPASTALDFTEGWNLGLVSSAAPTLHDVLAPPKQPAPKWNAEDAPAVRKADPRWSLADLMGMADFAETVPAPMQWQAPPTPTAAPAKPPAPVPAPARTPAPAPTSAKPPVKAQAPEMHAELAIANLAPTRDSHQPAPKAQRIPVTLRVSDIPTLQSTVTSQMPVAPESTPAQPVAATAAQTVDVATPVSSDTSVTPEPVEPVAVTAAPSMTPTAPTKPRRGFTLGDFAPLTQQQSPPRP